MEREGRREKERGGNETERRVEKVRKGEKGQREMGDE